MAADLSAVQAYQAAVKAAQQNVGNTDPVETAGGMDFSGLVTQAMDSTQTQLQGAEAMTGAAAAGQADLVDVVTAVSAAEITLETVVAVRDEVVKAYQEILRMPI